MTTPAMNAELIVREALKSAIKGEAKRDRVAGEVLEALENAGHVYENGWVDEVEVHDARVPVGTVEAYGLVIQVDASDNAVSVSSPHGFLISEAW